MLTLECRSGMQEIFNFSKLLPLDPCLSNFKNVSSDKSKVWNWISLIQGILMGEGFMLSNKGYGFRGCTTLKICTSTYDMMLKI